MIALKNAVMKVSIMESVDHFTPKEAGPSNAYLLCILKFHWAPSITFVLGSQIVGSRFGLPHTSYLQLFRFLDDRDFLLE